METDAVQHVQSKLALFETEPLQAWQTLAWTSEETVG